MKKLRIAWDYLKGKDMSVQIEVLISMSGQKAYQKAVEKYGEEFADTVVEKELQLFADNLDCFDEYAEYDFM